MVYRPLHRYDGTLKNVSRLSKTKKNYCVDRKKNEIRQANPCGETLVASVNFTSKLAFRIHNFGARNVFEKKKNITNPSI